MLMYAAGQQQGGWSSYAGKQAVLPDYPFMYIVPPTLVDQVTEECTKFLEGGGLDVIKLTGSFEKHREIWDETEKRAKTLPHMRIFIATTTVSRYSHRLCMRDY